MITELYIKNLGLIKENRVQFKEHLNVITGESGAGKSLILKGIQLLFSDRVTKEYIGNYGDSLIIKGLFDPTPSLISLLQDENISVNEDEYLIIEKTVSRKKKTVARVNQQPVSQEFLKNIASHLISMSLQNESSLFQNTNYILDILDSNNQEIIKQYQEVFVRYQKIKHEISQLKKNKKDNEEKLSYYEFQLNELEEFAIQPSDFELETVIKRVKNQTKLMDITQKISSKLDESYNDLYSIHTLMQELGDLDDSYKDAESFGEFFYQIEDFQDNISKYKRSLSFEDADDLTTLQSRLFKLRDFQKKYGETYEEIIEYQNSLVDKIESVQNFDDVLKKKTKQANKIYKEELLPLAKELHEKRLNYAKELSKIVTEHLADMSMENTKVIINVHSVTTISKTGMDNIEVLIQHLEQEPKPIHKIASGGELSRIILSLKIATSSHQESGIIIFDEIDSGTGGKTANSIGKKLKLLSENKQVICITHTPQVACYSDNHIFINKEVVENEYISKSINLDEESIILEIARMISGNSINEVTIEHARQLRNYSK